MSRHPALTGCDRSEIGHLRHVELLREPRLESEGLDVRGIRRRGPEGGLLQESPSGGGGNLSVRYSDLDRERLGNSRPVAHGDVACARYTRESSDGQRTAGEG